MNLILAAKANAALRGSNQVSGDDVVAVAGPILRHRILPTFSAEAAGMSSDKIIDRLLAEVPRAKG